MRRNKISVLLWLGALLCYFTSCSESKDSAAPSTVATITYESSNDVFANPERGFMRLFSVKAEGSPLSATVLSGLRSQHISLVHRVYYLDLFKDKPMSEAQLQLIRTDLQRVQEAGLKCILRFAYTDQMEGTDAPLAIVEQHLDQLKPLFEEHKAIIAFVQAGFIGAWGEWHASSNGLNAPENEKKVLFKLLEVLPQELMVQVRTPAKKQQIFDTTTPLSKSVAYTASAIARVGHHNDCFLSGGTNYGTYNNIEADKKYISSEALYVPTGGETCPPQGGYDPSCTEGRNEMQLLKWTYLNLDYYQPTLNAWKNSGCFNEFHRNLGYRLALVNASLASTAKVNQDYKVTLTLTNKGYAPLYSAKVTYLVLKDKSSGVTHKVLLPVDLRECKPTGTLLIDKTVSLAGVPQGDYDLLLHITDTAENLQSRSEYAIRLANANVWEESGMNNLNQSLKIGSM